MLGTFSVILSQPPPPNIVNYLEVPLNLTTRKYCPFRKPDNNPLHINAKSNHPPSIIRQIPASISTRLSSPSPDSTEFDKSSQLYDDALRSSGYIERIQCEENRQTGAEKNLIRSQNIIWLNPHFSENVQTNVAMSFLHSIDKHFPKSHKVLKIFTKKNLKVSYSGTTNMANTIKNHNRKILNKCEITNNRKR